MRARAQSAATLQLSWLHSVQFAGSYIAQERGWWRDAGLEVALLPAARSLADIPPLIREMGRLLGREDGVAQWHARFGLAFLEGYRRG